MVEEHQGDNDVGTSPGSPPKNERECSGDGLILSQESSRRHEPEVRHGGFKTCPQASASGLDSKNLPTKCLPEPSSLFIVNRSEHDDEDDDANENEDAFKPPVSVIVIQKPAPAPPALFSVSHEDSLVARTSGPHHQQHDQGGASSLVVLSPSLGAAGGTAGDGASPFIISSLPSFVTSSSSTASTARTTTTPARPRAASLSSTFGATASSSAASASPFRLQPRNPPKLTGPSPPLHAYGSPPRSSSHASGGASASMMSLLMSSSHRGRKRRAHSMSTYPDPTSTTSIGAAATATPPSAAMAKGGVLPSKSVMSAARGGSKAAGAAVSTPPLFTCAKPSNSGGVMMYGTGTPGDSIGTEITARESMVETPLYDMNSPASSSTSPTSASPTGRVLPTPTRVGGTWNSGQLKANPSDEAPSSGSPGGASAVHMMNFQGLSLLSPLRNGAANPSAYGDGASVDGSAAASPASSLHGSQASQARSCFSKYLHQHQHHHYQPKGVGVAASASAPDALSPRFGTPTRSVMAGGSSPKIAPLIVLGGSKAWHAGGAANPSNVTAQLESAAALMDAATMEKETSSKSEKSPVCAGMSTPSDRNKKRPPLHQHHGSSPCASAVAAPPPAPPSVNWMHSLDGSAVNNDDDDDPMSPRPFLPPPMVLCHPSTPGSTLSQDAQPRFLKAAAKALAAMDASQNVARMGSEIPQGKNSHAGSSDALKAAEMTTPSRGSGRARRSIDESPGKRSVTSMSPTSTPLPRLTLTPRSTTSSHAARQLFLSLPTPSDLVGSGSVGMDASMASAEAPAPPTSALPSPRRNSYIPLPDWASSGHYETSKASTEPSFLYENQNQRRGFASSHPPAASAAPVSTSLLSPPSPNDAIERFLKHSGANHHGAAVYANQGATGRDDDSLSASDDDDEAFFLATPLAIQEEKQSSLQQSKQRKLRDQSHTSSRSQHSFASSNIMQASSTSLRGMNFVTSSTSLDKIGSKPSSGALCLPQTFSSLKRQDSQTSIGLTLEGTNAPSSEESAAKDATAPGGRTSSSFSHSASTSTPTCFARDLVTPPVMAQPKSPPPLPSPRIPTTTSASAALPRSMPDHRGQRRDDLMDLEGSSWSPTTTSPPPAASSSQNRWPCAGEAESPMDMYTTRVYYTSTAPDGSPSD